MKKKIKQASEKPTVKGSIEAHGGFVEDGKTLEKRCIDYISKHAYDEDFEVECADCILVFSGLDAVGHVMEAIPPKDREQLCCRLSNGTGMIF